MSVSCSIIIPAFNAEKYICEAIDSVLSQECDFDFEIIVVDDGSTDRTAEAVGQYREKVRLIRKENGGPGSGRNVGGRQARTDILVFLDADDRMLPGRLAHQVGFMLLHPEVSLTFGNQLYQGKPDCDKNSENGLAYAEDFRCVDRAFQKLIVEGNYVANTTTAVRRSNYIEKGGMREDVFVCEDYDLCCKVALHHEIAYTSRKLTWYRQENCNSLMNSSRTYVGPAKVLYDNLLAHGDKLTEREYILALKRFRTLAKSLIRHEWAFNGRAGAMGRLNEFRELLPSRFRMFWRIAALCPPVVGRSARRILHHVRRQSDRRWEMQKA
jgi:glycosyltransferase involved in cell wall biosynthesis